MGPGARSAADSRSRVQSIISEASSPSRCAEAATRSVPTNAKATPTEQTTRYFHMASSDSGVTWTQIKKAVSSVVASMPTHISPRLLESSTAVIAAAEPNHSAPNLRAERRDSAPSASSPWK